MARYHYLIIGIDPGSRITGFACIGALIPQARTPGDFRVVDAGAIRLSSKEPHAKRITQLSKAIHQLTQELRPDYFVVEKAFYGVNVHTALKLAEARGAIISAACRLGVHLGEVSPAEVKKVVTGKGRASKEEVAASISALLGFDKKHLPTDVTDALAIALCFGLGLQRSGVSKVEVLPAPYLQKVMKNVD